MRISTGFRSWPPAEVEEGCCQVARKPSWPIEMVSPWKAFGPKVDVRLPAHPASDSISR